MVECNSRIDRVCMPTDSGDVSLESAGGNWDMDCNHTGSCRQKNLTE